MEFKGARQGRLKLIGHFFERNDGKFSHTKSYRRKAYVFPPPSQPTKFNILNCTTMISNGYTLAQ